ncbi:MAG: hypothetical protein JXB47_01030 [Anaerolineae bacterium]|nr:hypothetical protein [Anaerolineae bacterium]
MTTRTSISSIIAAFLRRRASTSFPTFREYRLALDTLETFADCNGVNTLDEAIDYLDWDAWAETAAAAISPRSSARHVQRSKRIAQMFLQWAQQQGYCERRRLPQNLALDSTS